MGRGLRRRGRRELLLVLLGVLLLTGTLVALAVRSPAVEVVELPSSSLPVPTPGVSEPPPPCDDAPVDDGSCGSEVPFAELLSPEAAAARLLAGSPLPEDVRFLLLTAEDWSILFDEYLGSAERVPGGEVVPAGRLAAAADAVPPVFGWQQEWRGDGFLLVEQALLFESQAQGQEFLSAWGAASRRLGVAAVDVGEQVPEFSGEALGAGALVTSFVDPTAVGFFADRRCGVDAAVAADRLVFLVSYFEGDGCVSARLAPAPMAAQALRDRLLAVLSRL